MSGDAGFPTIFGRGLLAELPRIVTRPALVVTMADLAPRVPAWLGDEIGPLYLVETLDAAALAAAIGRLPPYRSVVGIGGGQAVDVAKVAAWERNVPLFQVPTAMSVNAPFAHRAGLRVRGEVQYLGWVIPEAVFVDFDVIAAAPAHLNRSGIGDILCYHTAHLDWNLARRLGREEPRWPYDAALVAAARERLDAVLGAIDEIRDATEVGVRTLMSAHRWGGAAFFEAGWNPRPIEGMEHFVFYNLERRTGRSFVHGQPVGLGVYAGSVLHEADPDGMLDVLVRAGVDIRPEAMGVTWEDVGDALRTLPEAVESMGLWFTIASAKRFDDAVIEQIRASVVAAYGDWRGEP